MDAEAIERFIEECSAHHRHLCPRQVLGVRIGMAGARGLGLEAPRRDVRQRAWEYATGEKRRYDASCKATG